MFRVTQKFTAYFLILFCGLSAAVIVSGCSSGSVRKDNPAERLNKGIALFEIEQYEQAQQEFNRGAAEARLQKDYLTEAQCIKYIGNIYLRKELPDTAVAFYETADTLLSFLLNSPAQLNDSLKKTIQIEQANVLNNKALLLELQNQFALAAGDYEKVLDLDREEKNSTGEAKTLLNLGRATRSMGIYERNSGNEQKAVTLLKKASGYFRKSFDLMPGPDALMNLARCSDLLGETDSALAQYNRAAVLFRSSGRPLWYGITLGNMGMLQETLGAKTKAGGNEALATELTGKAISSLEEAVKNIESSRSSLTGEDSRASFFENKVFYYEQLIRILFQQKQFEKAFAYTERVKARSLADMLATKDIGKNKNYSPATQALITEEKNIRVRLKELEKFQDSAAVVMDLLNKYEATLNLIKKEEPGYTALRTAEPPSADEIRTRLNDSTALVEFFLGKSFSVAFLITKNTIFAREINSGRYDFNAEIEALRSSFVHFPEKKKDFFNKVEGEERKKGATDRYEILKTARDKWYATPFESAWQNKLLELYGVLFGAEFNEPLKAVKQLYIVPHGPLHHLPFNALVTSFKGIDRDKNKHQVRPKFLIEERSIVMLPAAGLLPLLKEPKGRPKTALIIGNPKYPPGWWNLDGAEKEADTVAQYFPDITPLKKEAATETAVKAEMGSKELIHFGTHGEFSEKALNSKIVLSADAQNDGFLTAGEMFNLTLNAYLVTLSACQSGQVGGYKKGSFSAGDDLVGLSRSLLFAGAENILATLWFVDDKATAEVMRIFYNRYLAKGYSIPAALREAQLSVLNSDENDDWKYPFFWAPYFHTGTFGK